MVQQQTRVKHTETFEKGRSKEAVQSNEVANNRSRDEEAETASNINKWLSSKICGKAC
jgi:hypothetical protein